MLHLLLHEEARGRGAGGARGPRCPAERGGPGEGPLGAPGGEVVVVVVVGLLAQAGGGQQGGVTQDVLHLLQVLQDVVVQQAGGHHGGARTRVPVKQSPVVQNQPL